jgi:hypothetical protein
MSVIHLTNKDYVTLYTVLKENKEIREILMYEMMDERPSKLIQYWRNEFLEGSKLLIEKFVNAMLACNRENYCIRYREVYTEIKLDLKEKPDFKFVDTCRKDQSRFVMALQYWLYQSSDSMQGTPIYRLVEALQGAVAINHCRAADEGSWGIAE